MEKPKGKYSPKTFQNNSVVRAKILKLIKKPQNNIKELNDVEKKYDSYIGDKCEVVTNFKDGTLEQKYQCNACKVFTTKNKTTMYFHIKEHDKDGNLNCSVCDFNAVNKGLLKVHMDSIHTRKPQKACDRCNTKVFTAHQLYLHKQEMHADTQWKCNMCDQRYSNQKTLRMHITQQHEQGHRGQFVCSKCGKTFVNKSRYRNHVDGVTCKRQFTCDRCGVNLTCSSMLQAHIDRVHDKKKNYQCPKCPFQAYTKQEVDNHQRTHFKEHLFKCSLCDFTAIKKYQVTSHIRTHTQERPFKCDLCPYSCNWKVQLKSHFTAHQSPTQVQCTDCGIILRNQKQLLKHFVTDHTKEGYGPRKKKQSIIETEVINTEFYILPQDNVVTDGSHNIVVESVISSVTENEYMQNIGTEIEFSEEPLEIPGSNVITEN